MKFHVSTLEILEPRAAPATLTGQVLTYTDLDGDHVSVTISKGTLLPADFTFNTGGVTGDNSTPQQLQLINLTSVADSDAANITVKVQKGPNGDGLAPIGAIHFGSRTLGTVNIPGDLGDLDGGSGVSGVIAVKSITVKTIGRYGIATQGVSGDEQWLIAGAVGSFKVAGDIRNAWINFRGDAASGPITVGGSLIAGEGDFSASIFASGSVGAVKIGHDLLGGPGNESGKLDVTGNIASLKIGGSIRGGVGDDDTTTDPLSIVHAGQVFASGDIGAITVGGALAGSIGSASGTIQAHGSVKGPVSLGSASHGILLSGGSMGAVKLLHGADLDITANGNLASVTVTGALTGNLKTTGTANLGPVKINGDYGGTIQSAGTLGAITINGTLQNFSTIQSQGAMGALKVKGDVKGTPITGGAGLKSFTVGGSIIPAIGGTLSTITFAGQVGPITVKGSWRGTFTSGSLAALRVGGTLTADVTVNGDAGLIQLGELEFSNLAVSGTLGSFSASGNAGGSIHAGDLSKAIIKGDLGGSLGVSHTLGSLTVGGNLSAQILTNAIGTLTAGSITGVPSFQIGSVTTIGKIMIRGDIASLAEAGLPQILADHLGSFTVGGSIVAGTLDTITTPAQFELLSVAHGIGQIMVKGDIRGSVGLMGSVVTVLIDASGPDNPTSPNDLAIGKITIGGTAEHLRILGRGIGHNAQIGAVKVGGDWIASDLVSGITNLGADDAPGGTGANADDMNFGDVHDHLVTGAISKIASITIGGAILGTRTTGDHFGFSAAQIGAFKYGPVVAHLTTGTDAPLALSPFTGDVTLRES